MSCRVVAMRVAFVSIKKLDKMEIYVEMDEFV
jgi:hypothetical protein